MMNAWVGIDVWIKVLSTYSEVGRGFMLCESFSWRSEAPSRMAVSLELFRRFKLCVIHNSMS